LALATIAAHAASRPGTPFNLAAALAELRQLSLS
jgi:hypothetical protein